MTLLTRTTRPTLVASAILMSLFAFTASAQSLILKNATVIDGTGAPARTVPTLLIQDGQIAYLGPADGLPTTAIDADALDLRDKYILPGLIDTHVHVARFPDARAKALSILEIALAGGVTTVRDMGGDLRVLSELSGTAARGEILIPTLVTSAVVGGPSLFRDERFDLMSAGYARGEAPWTRAVHAQADLVRVIAEARGAGASGIKVYGNLGADLAGRIIAEARRQDLETWAHSTVFPASPNELVNAGVGSLAHAPYLVWAAQDTVPPDFSARTDAPWSSTPPDHPAIRALLTDMANKRVALDATLFVFEKMHTFSPKVQAQWASEAAAWAADVVALAHKLGVPVTTGTDWFEPAAGETLPHTHDELVFLVNKANLSPMEAIVAATQNGARASGVLHQRGTIEVGKMADLLVLDADPLVDIRHTRRIVAVYKNGHRVDGASVATDHDALRE